MTEKSQPLLYSSNSLFIWNKTFIQHTKKKNTKNFDLANRRIKVSTFVVFFKHFIYLITCMSFIWKKTFIDHKNKESYKSTKICLKKNGIRWKHKMKITESWVKIRWTSHTTFILKPNKSNLGRDPSSTHFIHLKKNEKKIKSK